MPFCGNCGQKSPPEMTEILADYQGEYFCSEECRDEKRQREEGLFGEYQG